MKTQNPPRKNEPAASSTSAASTPSRSAKSQTDLLFGRPIEADKPAPTIEADDLRDGAIVRHVATRTIEYKDRQTGAARKAQIHSFAMTGGVGRWFSLFGSAQLNSQIRKAKPGAILFLRYLGRVAAQDGTEPHTWEVRETAANAAQIANLIALEWGDREAALSAAIDAATEREKARREQNREPEPPPHTDDDIPF